MPARWRALSYTRRSEERLAVPSRPARRISVIASSSSGSVVAGDWYAQYGAKSTLFTAAQATG